MRVVSPWAQYVPAILKSSQTTWWLSADDIGYNDAQENRQEERTTRATLCANETKKAKRVLAEILGQHDEELLPLVGREAA